MLVELSIIPLGGDTHLSDAVTIEDQQGAHGKLAHNVAAVASKLGKPAQRLA